MTQIIAKNSRGRFLNAIFNEKTNIEANEVTRGVSVTKFKVAQRPRHLEKTIAQDAPTTVKHMPLADLEHFRKQKKGGEGLYT